MQFRTSNAKGWGLLLLLFCYFYIFSITWIAAIVIFFIIGNYTA